MHNRQLSPKAVIQRRLTAHFSSAEKGQKQFIANTAIDVPLSVSPQDTALNHRGGR
jgi:hypothetical protein